MGLAVMRALRDTSARLEGEKAALEAQVAALRHLVGEAFAEGFRARDPEGEALWLADWLTSAARARLEALRQGAHAASHGHGDPRDRQESGA